MGNKIIKSVSLNVTNEKDKEILNHVKRRNFSGYVKKLILADIEARKGEKRENEPIEDVKNDMPKTPIDRLEELKQRAAKINGPQ